MARKNNKNSRWGNLKDMDFSQGRLEVSDQARRGVIIICLFALSLLLILSLVDSAGTLGVYVNGMLQTVFGLDRWVLPIITLLIGYFLSRPIKYGFRFSNFIGLLLFIIGFNAFLHVTLHADDLPTAARLGLGGGYAGLILAWPLLRYTGFWATLVIGLAVAVIGLLLLFETYLVNFIESRQTKTGRATDEDEDESESRESLLTRLKSSLAKTRERNYEAEEVVEEEIETPVFSKKDVAENDDDEEVSEEGEGETKKVSGEKALNSSVDKFKNIKVDLPIALLDGKASTPKGGDIKANKEIIRKTLENFGVNVEMGESKVGPTVTQYTLKPAEGVRLSKITGLNDNLALALAAHPIRIEAPIPGMSLVGIEVPNQTTSIVPLKEIMSSEEFRTRNSNLAIALGKDVMGKSWLFGLDKMPHLLIAGSTGSGKSVCINSVILSLLFQNGPGQLKFIMVDPKRVELPLYNGIPHLLTPVITDVKKTINALRWAIKEMEKRFDILSSSHHRNIASYNAKREDIMPYIVIVIDELADLMASSGPEVEAAIVRLAQMSRAVGIHLVLATQRPSVDVITGLIKANITSRIAFSVASLVDSRTILDMSGAEKLLGRGDMLYLSAEIQKPKRLQGAFASDDEIKRVITHLKKQAEPDYIEAVVEKQGLATGEYDEDSSADDSDPLIDQAVEVVVRAKKASTSFLQRHLRIGYSRAARLIDLLEARGIVGPADGARPRDVLISRIEDAKLSGTKRIDDEVEPENDDDQADSDDEADDDDIDEESDSDDEAASDDTDENATDESRDDVA